MDIVIMVSREVRRQIIEDSDVFSECVHERSLRSLCREGLNSNPCAVRQLGFRRQHDFAIFHNSNHTHIQRNLASRRVLDNQVSLRSSGTAD